MRNYGVLIIWNVKPNRYDEFRKILRQPPTRLPAPVSKTRRDNTGNNNIDTHADFISINVAAKEGSAKELPGAFKFLLERTVRQTGEEDIDMSLLSADSEYLLKTQEFNTRLRQVN